MRGILGIWITMALAFLLPAQALGDVIRARPGTDFSFMIDSGSGYQDAFQVLAGGPLVPSGKTLTLTGATIAGSPTWSSTQSFTNLTVTTGLTLTGSTITGAPTWSNAQSFPSASFTASSDQITLSAGVNALTISSGTSAAARTYGIPDAGASASFVMTGGLGNNEVVYMGTQGKVVSEQYLNRTRGGTGITSTATFPASGTIATTSNNLGAFAATTSAQLAGVISDETGSGVLVFGTSPTFTTGISTPKIDFPSAGTLNKTGTGTLTLASGADTSTVTKSGTGGLTLATGANAVSMTWGAAATLTMPTGTVTVASTSNKLSDFSSTTSAELAGVISNETGTGVLVFGTSPTFTTQITTPRMIIGSQTSKATIAYTTNTARTYTLPDAGAAANFVMSEGTATINGAKTFGNAAIFSSTITAGSPAGSPHLLYGGLTFNNGNSAADRIWLMGANTTDGSDNHGFYLASGGDAGPTRGAYIRMFGNEADFGASLQGLMEIYSGYSSGTTPAAIKILPGGVEYASFVGDLITTSKPLVVGTSSLGANHTLNINVATGYASDTQYSVNGAVKAYIGVSGSGSNLLDSAATAGDLVIRSQGGNILFSNDGTLQGSKTSAGAWTLGPAVGNNNHIINFPSNGNYLQLNGSGFSGLHILNGTEYFIQQNSNSRVLSIRSGTTLGVTLAAGGNSWSAYSDETLKRDITKLEYGLDTILSLADAAIRFNYKEDSENTPSRIGMSAQKVKPILPEAISTHPNGKLMYSADVVTPVLITSMKELYTKLQIANTRIECLANADTKEQRLACF